MVRSSNKRGGRVRGGEGLKERGEKGHKRDLKRGEKERGESGGRKRPSWYQNLVE